MAASSLPPVFFVDRSERGRLRVSGRDRQSFLQGMVSNDVGRLTPGEGCYAFQLDATGHILADMRVLCTEDYLILDVEPGMAPTVAETLERYLIMERAKITDVTGETAQIFIGGEEAPHLLETLAVPGSAEWSEGTNGPVAVGESETFPARVAATRLIPAPGYDVYLASDDVESLRSYLKASGAVEWTPEQLEPLRIEAGVPRYGIDMESRVLAPETGLQRRAISYRKGCYIGQEIVARIDARGHTNRGLVGFTLAEGSELPARDTPVVIEGKEVGRITSAAVSPTLDRPIALGYIRHEHSEPGTAVEIASGSAQVTELPFAQP